MRPGLLIVIAAALLATTALARHGRSGFAQLDRRAAAHRDKAEVMAVPGGDLMMRDIPKTFQLLEGRFFADAHYEGEVHWYPFMNALAATAVHRWGDGWVHTAYLRCAVLSTLAFWAAALVLLFVLIGPGALMLWPALIWLDWLRPTASFYPAEGARPALTLFMAVAIWATARERTLGPGRVPVACVLGALTGVLGLWHGASFFTAIAVCTVLAVVHLGRSAGTARARALPLVLYPAGLLLVLSPLLLPQLLHYGTIRAAGAARLWLSPEYRDGNFPAALKELALAPRGLDLVLALVFLDRWLRDPARRLKYAPLGIAWAFSLTLAHLGFVMHDSAHPLVASLIRKSLPAPPHTLHHVSVTCLSFMKALALWWMASALARRLQTWCSHFPRAVRLLGRLGASRSYALPAAGIVTLATFAALPPRTLEVLAEHTDRPFVDFAQRLSSTVGRGVVYMKHPSRITALAPMRVLYFGAPDHANHYVQKERAAALDSINQRLGAGDGHGADTIFDRYQVAYLVEDPRIPGGEAIIARCGGPVLLEHAGYRLRRRAACRR